MKYMLIYMLYLVLTTIIHYTNHLNVHQNKLQFSGKSETN